MEQRVFPALGMKNTYINVPPAKINDYARGYSEEGAPTRVSNRPYSRATRNNIEVKLDVV
jgi:CubicO group peptidase (beta-lactamase class C family)